MESRKTKIMLPKTSKGYITPRITLPVPWVSGMNITEDCRDVKITFDDNNRIIIEKIN